MAAKKSNVIAGTVAITWVGLLFGCFGTGAFLSHSQHVIDEDISQDVLSIVDKTDRILLADGAAAFSKDIKDLGITYELQSPATSLQVAGTFRDGYCIRLTNPGGRETEAGKTYSVSAEGELSRGTARCNTVLRESPVVAGPAIDENSKTEWEVIDTALIGSIGMGGVTLLGIMGAMFSSIGSSPTNPTGKQTSESNTASESSGEPPVDPEKGISVKVASVKPEPVSDTQVGLNVRIAAVKKEWSSYEMDLVKILDYPAVANMSFPATSDFHKAMRQVNVLVPEGVPSVTTSPAVLSEAVLDLEHKFDVMIAEAKRSKWSIFTDDERISLRTAQNLLSIAINAASSPNERQIAYKRLIREVEGILAFPEKALLELEARIAPEICESKMETNMVTA